MISYFISVLVLMSMASWAEDKTPLTKEATATSVMSGCRVSEARPVLRKSMYSGHSSYAVSTIGENPLTLLETVNIDQNITLKIEHKGCRDISMNFKIAMSQGNKSYYSVIRRGTKILNDLHIDPNSLLSVEQLNEIATKVKNESSRMKNTSDFTVCITKKSDLCAADVKVTATMNAVDFVYVARP